MVTELLEQVQQNNFRAIARAISIVENEVNGYDELLRNIPASPLKTIGITGPPGAGKSTLVNGLIGEIVTRGKSVAVLCIDPSSPFNKGALLGDRIRMLSWYNNSNVFIRSLATRGNLGGVNPKILEVADVIKAASFDYIIIETVGVGQTEVEIAGLADATVVVLVPEAGDEIQAMKAGLMEIADLFVVNKADRPGADTFTRHLQAMMAPMYCNAKQVKILQTISLKQEGIDVLLDAIEQHLIEGSHNELKYWSLAEKAYQLILQKRMRDIRKEDLFEEIKNSNVKNIYKFLHQKQLV